MVFHIIPQPFDHVQADIADVIGPHHSVSGAFQDAADHVAQDGAAQVPHMEGLVCVRIGELHHHLFTLGFPTAEHFAFLQHAVDHPPGEVRRREVQIQISPHRLHPRETRRRAQIRRHPLGDLLGALGHVQLLPRARLLRRHLKERGRNAPLPSERDRVPLQFTGLGQLVLGAILADL